ncbi:MAG: class I SAM-dependent methyltransferase [Actinobacteria bacterium]|nr:class I SAM-dependent methyltransferase [Actinomycetota bacterium]
MTQRRGRRLYAALYERINEIAERRYLGAIRAEVAGSAAGQVLEIGAGASGNFRFYRADAHQVVAVEPDPAMAELAVPKARRAAAPVALSRAVAERLPFRSEAFDTVVTSLVLCTVDLDPTLREIRRVLRPGGRLRFYEHVRYRHPVGRFMQDAVTPLWRRFASGCHPNRDLVGRLRQHDFAIERVDEFTVGLPLPPYVLVRPQVKGVAVRG